MRIQFQTPAEAFAAIATVVIAGDRVCTTDERDYLFQQVSNLDMFRCYDRSEFAALLKDVVERIYWTLPLDETSITVQGIDHLVQAVREVLSREQRAQAHGMALGLARADKLREEEQSLLEQLQRGLQIDGKSA